MEQEKQEKVMESQQRSEGMVTFLRAFEEDVLGLVRHHFSVIKNDPMAKHICCAGLAVVLVGILAVDGIDEKCMVEWFANVVRAGLEEAERLRNAKDMS
jgi:hypothetical protein